MVQAPHCAMPQPNFVPVRPNSSRTTHNSRVSGSISSLCVVPLTLSVIIEPSLSTPSVPDRIAPIPTHGGVIHLRVLGLEKIGHLDQFDESGQMRRRIHKGEAHAARRTVGESHFIAEALVLLDAGLEVMDGHRPMVKPVAALGDQLLEYRRYVVVLLNQFKLDMPGKSNCNRHVEIGRLTAIAALGRLERPDLEPGTDTKPLGI